MTVDAFLNADAATGRVAMAARLAVSHCSPTQSCPRYFEALNQALADEPPPFDTSRYAEIYTEASADWRWMAVSLMTNAEREGDGAKRLWSLAACSVDSEVQHLLKLHAVDESRHALLYLALLDLAFGDAIDPAFRADLDSLSPHFALKQELAPIEGSPYAKNPTIDDFLQMNIAEIRTAIHHIMQRPALARYSSDEAGKRIVSIQDSLLRDELKHVAYTAVLIEGIAGTLPATRLSDLFHRRFRDFNRITVDELGEGAFDCSAGCCERHDACRPKAPLPAQTWPMIVA